MKKAVAIIITILMLAALAIPAFADAQTDVVGYSDARVEVKDLSAVPSVFELVASLEAPTSTEYKISTAAELAVLGSLSAPYAYDGITLYLANDIDMAGQEGFIPISGGIVSAEPAVGFRGTFDGQGYEIKNLTIDGAGTHHVGLFGILQGATIKNLIFGEGCKVTNANQKVGGIVGAIYGDGGSTSTIENCWNKADVEGTVMVGGIAGRAFVSIKTEAYENQDTTAAANITTHIIKNCTNSGKVTAGGSNGRDVGGILGLAQTGVIIENCRNTGDVASGGGDKVSRGTGGIVGRIDSLTISATAKVEIKGCINNGNVTSAITSVAAIVGNAKKSGIVISDCKNFGTITAPTGVVLSADQIWGIDGDTLGSNASATDCTNNPGGEDATKAAALAADQTIVGNAEPPETTDTETETETEAATTKAPETQATTEAATTAAPAAEEEAKNGKGCGSSIAIASVALITACAGAVAFAKRKED